MFSPYSQFLTFLLSKFSSHGTSVFFWVEISTLKNTISTSTKDFPWKKMAQICQILKIVIIIITF